MQSQPLNLNLSNAGPAVAEGRAGSDASTGAITFNPPATGLGSVVQSVLPLAALFGVVWLVMRKK